MSSSNRDPQPSTSRASAAPTTRRSARSAMTPSPFSSNNNSDEEDEVEVQVSSKKLKQQKEKTENSVKRRLDSNDLTVSGRRSKRNKRSEDGVYMEVSDGDEEFQPKSKSSKKKRNKSTSDEEDFEKLPPKKTSRSSKKATGRSTPPSSARSPSPADSTFSVGFAHSQSTPTEEECYAGVIKNIQLKNFMCHTNFNHDFHKNLNFIVGQNGSGKSALLSGLLIVLGGKAQTTSRTSSVKQLVQKGKSVARVTVTLYNKKGLAKYGDEITIERWVNVSGSGGYRIKSSRGSNNDGFEWRQLKKPELDWITMGLNIQIDNPVAILNQEVARSFLRSKDPKVKYKLFYEGSRLSEVKELLDSTKGDLVFIKNILTNQRKVIDELTKEVKELKLRYDKIAQLDNIKDKMARAHREWLWAHVVEKETAVEEITQEIQKLEADITVLRQRLTKIENDLSETNSESIQQKEDEVRRSCNSKKKEMEEIRSQLSEVRKKEVFLNKRLENVCNSLTAKESKLNKLRETLQNKKAEQEAQNRDQAQEDESRIHELARRKSELQSIAESMKTDYENFTLAAEQEQNKVQEVELTAKKLMSEIESKRRFLNNLKNRTWDKYEPFGSQMKSLMQRIKASAHKFRHQPRGPLGACIKVKNPRYAPLIEFILNNHLHSFVVGDPQDFALLRELIGSVYNNQRASHSGRQGRTPGIFQVQYSSRLYDISQRRVTLPGAPSIIDLIEVEGNDTIVMNTLIDIAEIEVQVIFPDDHAAAQVMKNERAVPRSLKTGYTLKQWFKFAPAPHYSARPLCKPRQRCELLKNEDDKEDQMRNVQEEITELQRQVGNCNEDRQEIYKKEKEAKDLVARKRNELQGIRRQLSEAESSLKREMQRIKDREKQGDLTSFYEEIQEIEEDIEKCNQDRDTCTKQLEPFSLRIASLEAKKNEVEKSLEALTAELQECDDNRDKLDQRRTKLENALKKASDMITSKQKAKGNLDKELEALEKVLKEKIDAAQSTCPERVNTKRTPAAVKKEFDGLKLMIEEGQKRLGNKEIVEAELRRKDGHLNSLKSDYDPLCRMHKTVLRTHTDQAASFEELMSQTGNTLTFFFSHLTRQRGYGGRMIVDNENKELYYVLCPDGDSSSKILTKIDNREKHGDINDPSYMRTVRDLKSTMKEYGLGLSGGERSFATICFILSLWQVMECPFYMLDEFDVFMDAFNRKTSQSALMAHAKQHPRNQFVLFTPLDIDQIPSEKEGRVLRLGPPQRSKPTDGRSVNDEAPSSAGSSSVQQSPPSPNENVDPKATETSKRGPARSKGNTRRVMGLIE